LHTITFAFATFTLSPFHCTSPFHCLSSSVNSFSIAANSTWSSTHRSSYGRPSLNSANNACKTIMNNKGLSTDPLLSTHYHFKILLSPPSTLSAIISPSEMAVKIATSYSLTPRLLSVLSANHTTWHWALLKGFSRSTKIIHSSLFFAKNLPWTCHTAKMASLVSPPQLNPSCISLTFTSHRRFDHTF
jgi:hypothetical protein